jgi:alpha-beta hydrolase superfamily lysophospholipase
VRDEISKLFPDIPVVLSGHSMGGNFVLNLLMLQDKLLQSRENNKDSVLYKKVIVGSPWLRLASPLPPIVVAFARVAGGISSKFAITNKLALEFLTHDEKIVETVSADTLYHNRISLKLAAAITRHGIWALSNGKRIKLPVFLLEAGDDKIVSVPAIEEFAANAGKNITLKKYEGMYHELHNETIRDEVFEDIYQFIIR